MPREKSEFSIGNATFGISEVDFLPWVEIEKFVRLFNPPPKIGMLGKLRAVKLALGGEIGGVFGSVFGGAFLGLWRG